MYKRDDGAVDIIYPDDPNKKEEFPANANQQTHQTQALNQNEQYSPHYVGGAGAYMQALGPSGQPGIYSGQPQNQMATHQGYGWMQPNPYMVPVQNMGGSFNPSYVQPSPYSINPGMNGMIRTDMPPGGNQTGYPQGLFMIAIERKFKIKIFMK
jgi:hypothetical protein